jgi:uncharacterized RDD family membrane protein YckC
VAEGVCLNHTDVSAGLVQCARCGKTYCLDCVVEIEGKPYDAACKEERIRDLRSGPTSVPLASAVRRLLAVLVDWIVFFPVTAAFFYAFGEGSNLLGIVVREVSHSIPWIAYEGIMLHRFDGQTVGKKALGLQVVGNDGSPIQPAQAWKRAVASGVMSATYLLGLVDCLLVFSERRRTLHDRIARTVVIERKR